MYKIIDLFAGIGGIRRGFEMTGHFYSVLSAEKDKYACKTYQHLYGENPENDVTSKEFKNKIKEINYDVLLAGFPCQSFSMAGKKMGFEDKIRGTLFFDVAEILKLSKPKAFLLENSEGFLKHNGGKTLHRSLEILILDLKYEVVGVSIKGNKLIYDKDSFIRNTKDFGLPQNRRRTYIVGFRKDILKNRNLEELPRSRQDINLYQNLNDLLEFGAQSNFYLSQSYLDTLKRHKCDHKRKGNGFGYEIINERKVTNPTANTILATGGSGRERNLVYDYQEGISGKKLKIKKSPLNNEYIRIMTPREWGKLQGFINYAFVDKNGIDQFTFPNDVSNTQLYKQFGNSVSIPVIESIAKYIYKILDNKNTID